MWRISLFPSLLLGTIIFFSVPEDTGTLVPRAIYLTWTEDPTTTMVVDWHLDTEIPLTTLQYRREGHTFWRPAPEATTFPFPFSTERDVYRVHLSGLLPGTSYEFRFGPQSRIYRFRTMPETADEPIRIAAGGDTMHDRRWMRAMNSQVMEHDPDFIVWGGDLAYADGREDKIDRWFDWFDAVTDTLIAADGRAVPILVAIGNHEVRGGYTWGIPGYTQTDATRAAAAPYFYTLFAMPGQPGYTVLDFGDYLSILLLDTNHTNPIGGVQTAWLQETLAARTDVTHVVPVYHQPAWPSVRAFGESGSTAVRLNWVPLFEQYGVRVVFENHDHSYKRTVPIRENLEAEDGIVYIGDGAWGVAPRQVKLPEATWYLERAETVRNAVIMTIHNDLQGFVAINPDGKVIDEVPMTPPVAKETTSDQR